MAPFVGIRFRAVDEVTYVMRVPGKQRAVDISLSSAIAHLRLIAEMFARSAKWVHFHFGESCRDSLLGQTDARLRRVAALYALDTLGSVSIRGGEVTVRFVPKADLSANEVMDLKPTSTLRFSWRKHVGVPTPVATTAYLLAGSDYLSRTRT